MRRLRRVLLGLLLFLVGLVHQAPDAPGPPPEPPPGEPSEPGEPGEPEEPGEPGEPDFSGLPDGARERLQLIVDLYNGAELTGARYQEHFAPEFRELVTLEQAEEALAPARALAPFEVVTVIPVPPSTVVAIVTAADGLAWEITLVLDEAGLVLGTTIDVAELADPPATLDDAAAQITALGTLRLVAADVDGTTCAPRFGRDADEPAPVASAFKLHVLGAVADAVAAGALRWDDELTITALDKSWPAGELQDRPDGSTVTVQEAARLMIAISDNTATDLLMRTVGREAVEDAQATYGHSRPELNVPLPTTRELFLLKADEARQQRWVAGDADERRAVLAELSDVPVDALPPYFAGGVPVAVETVEWFASPLDLCRALATLVERGAEPGLEPVLDALTANPGLPDPDGRWARIAFKGGSEPGVLAMAWLVEDSDGRRSVLAGSVVDAEAPFSMNQATLLFGAARDLLAEAPPATSDVMATPAAADPRPPAAWPEGLARTPGGTGSNTTSG
jgi:hypothetical protein